MSLKIDTVRISVDIDDKYNANKKKLDEIALICRESIQRIQKIREEDSDSESVEDVEDVEVEEVDDRDVEEDDTDVDEEEDDTTDVDSDDSCDENDLHDDRDYVNNLKVISVRFDDDDTEKMKERKVKMSAEIINYINDQKIEKLKSAVKFCKDVLVKNTSHEQKLWCALNLPETDFETLSIPYKNERFLSMRYIR